MTSPPETFSSLIEKLRNVSFSKISRSFYNRLVMDDKGWTLRTSYLDKVSILLLYLFILKLFNTDRIKTSLDELTRELLRRLYFLPPGVPR